MALSALFSVLVATLPSYSPTRISVGQYSAVIRYDQHGIPRIRASSENDLLFALGYAVAKERLFSLAKKRAVATGTASELFGRQAAELDTFIRQVGLNRLGRDLAALVEREDKALYSKVQSYCDGVNAFVERATFLPV